MTPLRKLSVSEAARFLGVSKSFLNKARLTGNGPLFIKIGARVVYDLSDIEDWLVAKRMHHTAAFDL